MDFTFGYFLIARGFFFCVSIWYFTTHDFNFNDYCWGFIASMCDITGCFLVNSAVATGSPIGPTFALCDTQILMITVFVTFYLGIVPHWM